MTEREARSQNETRKSRRVTLSVEELNLINVYVSAALEDEADDHNAEVAASLLGKIHAALRKARV